MHWSFYIFLFFAIWFTYVNTVLAINKRNISATNMIIMSAAIAGCVWSALEMGHSCP